VGLATVMVITVIGPEAPLVHIFQAGSAAMAAGIQW
jgi:hypothetical protein